MVSLLLRVFTLLRQIRSIYLRKAVLENGKATEDDVTHRHIHLVTEIVKDRPCANNLDPFPINRKIQNNQVQARKFLVIQTGFLFGDDVNLHDMAVGIAVLSSLSSIFSAR